MVIDITERKIAEQKLRDSEQRYREAYDRANPKKEVLFKEGFRIEKGTKGMGLGLSLVHKILQMYNGKIWVENKIKEDFTKGSIFVILIPEFDSIYN